MAKKSMNPADAHRKAQRAKELKRNKEDRKKTREVATLKKDTGGLEARIGKLAAIAKPTKADELELASLRAELEYTSKLKREYVEKHPEHRKFVYAREVAEEKAKQEREDKGEGPSSGSGGGRGGGGGNGLYDRDGRLRRPERSLYYDPVLNPYGVPPPGMPYRERPPTPEPLPKELQSESESESSSEDDSDDDIVMPAGPPPGASSGSDSDEGESSDSDDSIIFPSGPPPPKAAPLPPLPPGPPPPPGMFGMMPPPPGFNPHVPPPGFYPPQPHMMMNQAMMMPPQPAGFYGRPPPPPPNVHIPYQPGGGQPPFHGGAFPPHPPNHRGARAQNGRRPPGPSAASAVPARPAAPASASATASISSLPPKPGSSLPANPTAKSAGPRPPPPPPAAVSALDALASSTSAAEPVLRDFKKESAAFVPAAVKRRRKEEAARDAKRVKAAPDVGGDWGAPLEGFDDDPSTATSGGYAPLEGFDDDDSPYAAPTSVAAPATVVPKVIPKATGPISFGSANNPLLGGLASVLGKAGFVPRTAAAAAPKEKKPDRDGYGAFLSGLDGLDK